MLSSTAVAWLTVITIWAETILLAVMRVRWAKRQ